MEHTSNMKTEEPKEGITDIENPVQKQPPQELEIRLLSSGSYGCVFTPEIKCDGEIGDIHYVSKIQKSGENTQNEIIISNKIREISHYDHFFAPVLETCPAKMGKIDEEEIKKCDIFYDNNIPTEPNSDEKPIPSQEYISTKVRFIGNNQLEMYLRELPRKTDIIEKKMITTYEYLEDSLKKISQKNIIHFDIKEKNIMYDENNHSPIIIDFGISFVPFPSTMELHKTFFYTQDYYHYWCIDIYILSFIVNVVRKGKEPNVVSSPTITKLVDDFLQKWKEMNKEYSIMWTEEEYTNINTQYNAYFNKYVGKPWETLFEDHYVPEIYFTWDIYSLATTFLIYTRHVYYQEPSIVQKSISKDEDKDESQNIPLEKNDAVNVVETSPPNADVRRTVAFVSTPVITDDEDNATIKISKKRMQQYIVYWKLIVSSDPDKRKQIIDQHPQLSQLHSTVEEELKPQQAPPPIPPVEEEIKAVLPPPVLQARPQQRLTFETKG